MSNGRPRRRSIFGGLLFILIGGLLLVNNLYADLRLGELFRNYWPVLLILWGLSKLFDYFAARRTGDASPPAFSGGEFFLLLLLLCVGGFLTFVEWAKDRPDVNFEFPIFSGESHTFPDEALQRGIKLTSPVSISTDSGDITVIPEEEGDIRVVAQKTVYGMRRESDAQKRANDVRIEISETGGRYEVRPALQNAGRRRLKVDLEVHVPKQVSVEARTERGAVKITGVEGGVTVNAPRGNIEVREVGKDVEVEMRNGDVQISGIKGNVRLTGKGTEIEISDVNGEVNVQGEFYGPIRFKNVSKESRYLSQRTDLTVGPLPGRLEINRGDLEIYDASGSVALTTTRKNIRLENIGGRIQIDNKKGDVEVVLKSAPREEIEVTNESGSVELSLPEKSGFEISASSRNGEAYSDFTGPDLKQTNENGMARLEGRHGLKGPKIQLRTTYGTVSVRKSA
jgi:DUF4097 and DUF4098 domain-containing protein YvlB